MNNTALEDARNNINSLDLTHVINRVVKEKKWSPRMGQVAGKFYRNFLLLCKKHPKAHLSPTLQIDEIWHAHILYTQDYHAFCDKVFGKYLHHQPLMPGAEEAEANNDAIGLLQKLHQEEFGEPIYDAVYSFVDLYRAISRT